MQFNDLRYLIYCIKNEALDEKGHIAGTESMVKRKTNRALQKSRVEVSICRRGD